MNIHLREVICTSKVRARARLSSAPARRPADAGARAALAQRVAPSSRAASPSPSPSPCRTPPPDTSLPRATGRRPLLPHARGLRARQHHQVRACARRGEGGGRRGGPAEGAVARNAGARRHGLPGRASHAAGAGAGRGPQRDARCRAYPPRPPPPQVVDKVKEEQLTRKGGAAGRGAQGQAAERAVGAWRLCPARMQAAVRARSGAAAPPALPRRPAR
jgi:hypothetical protein